MNPDNSRARPVVLAGLLALSACAVPREAEHQPIKFIEADSQGVSELRNRCARVTIEFASETRESLQAQLIDADLTDGKCAAIDGVVFGIHLSNPNFLRPDSNLSPYRDRFGNFIVPTVQPLSFLGSLNEVAVSFPIRVTTGGELIPTDIDLTRLGGPLVRNVLVSKSLTCSDDSTIISDIPPDELREKYGATLRDISDGAKEIEKICGLAPGSLLNRIAVIGSQAAYAGCVEVNPDTLIITTECLSKVPQDSLAAKIIGRHEALHLLDRWLGYPSGTEAFKSFHREMRKNSPQQFEAVNESSIYQGLTDGGHAQDSPRELWASFLNYLILRNEGHNVPSLEFGQRCAALILEAIKDHPINTANLTAILKSEISRDSAK